MKKSIVLVIVAVISVSAAILGCSNSKASSSDSYNNPIIYEDKDIKVYSIPTEYNLNITVAFSKKTGDIDICRR